MTRIFTFQCSDHYWEFIQDCIACGDGPTTVQPRLGYLLSGPLPVSQSIEAISFHVSALSCIMEETEPHTLWQVESVGTTLPRQDAECNFLQEHMANKISVQPDGAYSLKFPWKTAQ